MRWINKESKLCKRISETRLFWIYFAGVILIWSILYGSLLFLPEVSLVVLGSLLYAWPVWYLIMAVICYGIGKDVQRRGQRDLIFRLGFAAAAAVMTSAVFPVMLDAEEMVRYHRFSMRCTAALLTWDVGNIPWYLQAGITFAGCWAGQEAERRNRIEAEKQQDREAEKQVKKENGKTIEPSDIGECDKEGSGETGMTKDRKEKKEGGNRVYARRQRTGWKKKMVLALVILLCGVIAAGQIVKARIGRAADICVITGICTRISENHGGFHGDGTTIYQVKIWGDSVLRQIEEGEHWRELPLSDPLESYVYGGGVLDFPFPEIQNGYYFFLDRHTKSTDPYDETEMNHRGSHNFTLVIYDTDNHVLYYLALDT